MKTTAFIHFIIGLLSALISLFFFYCNHTGNHSPTAHPAAKEISVSWEVVENFFQNREAFKSQFTITNNSTIPLADKGWTFYFNFSRVPVPDSVPETVKITHINGDFYKLTPTPKWPVLKKGESLSIPFVCTHWAINYTDAPAGGYFVFTAKDGTPQQPEPVGEIKVKPFVHERQTRRNGNDNTPVPTPQSRFKENRKLQIPAGEPVQKIIPTPVRMESKNGFLVLHGGFEIHYADGLEKEAAFLKNALRPVFINPLKTVRGTRAAANAIVLERAAVNVNGTRAEAYRLRINRPTGIRITGSDDRGVFYGIRSLQALLPPAVYREPQREIKLQNLVIEDAPRFPYRGLHLDVARNFHDKATVKKFLNLMSFYKLNTLHFHLTNDEGWRLDIPSLPELTQVGAFRGHTEDESDCLYPSFGSGPFKDPARSRGCGYYTRPDFIEILKHAHERKIEVIPEIDVPGHARAAVKAMDARYRRLMKEGKKEEAEEFLLRDLSDRSTYQSVQYWNDNTLCVCRESVYRFLEVVVDDIREMYRDASAPLTTVHIGGDEVPRGVWEQSPICRELIRENKQVSHVHQLFAYFIKRFNRILESRGLVTAGWQEIALKHAETGDSRPVPNSEFAGKNVLPYVWNNVWGLGKEDVGHRLANAGYPVVIAYVTNLYFDLAYKKDPFEPGYYWGGFIDTRKAYELTPFDIRKCVSLDLFGNPLDRERLFKEIQLLTTKGKTNIRGIQGHLWSENARDRRMLEYLAFPKSLGLAERAWAAQPAWARISDDAQREKELNRAWSRFANALGRWELARLDYLWGGVRYRIPLPGAVVEDGVLNANIAFPGLDIHYTTDGSRPDLWSPRYKGPVRLGKEVKTVKLRAFSRINRSSRTAELSLD